MLIAIFLFAGALAAIAGGLFATLQTYITPDAFTFDLSVLFFIAILIGGRGSILGPMLGTIILTILPEIAAPLAAWSTFLYAVLLLVIVLVMPGGIAALLDFRNRRPLASNRAIVPRPAALADIVRQSAGGKTLALRGIALTFGNVRAIDGLDLDVAPGQIHGLIGPNGSGKTTTLNVISGYYAAKAGTMTLGDDRAAAGPAGAARRQRHRPHLPDPARDRRGLGAGERDDRRHHRGHSELRRGDAGAAAQPARRAHARRQGARAARRRRPRNAGRCPRRPPAAQRIAFHRDRARADAAIRISCCSTSRPPASPATRSSGSAALIKAISARGTGVLLVEHHADLIFDICDQVTVLNLGRMLAAGTPAEIRVHKEVVSAYLGG